MSEQYYFKKYLKYKMKYDQIIGGSKLVKNKKK